MLRAGRAAEPEALEIGVSGPEQRAEIEEIWRASFPEDSAAARALFLDRLLPCGYCLSGSVGGRPVTMALWPFIRNLHFRIAFLRLVNRHLVQ